MSKVDLYIGTDLLDFSEEINVKRQVKDYRDTSLGSTNKSYTLQIPLTAANKKILQHVQDVRSRGQVSDQGRIVVDGMEIIRGKVRILRAAGEVARTIIEADDWLDGISGKSIKSLSWDSGDEHTFSKTNVQNSWTAAAGALYRYPMFNFAELLSGDYGAGGSDLYIYDFYPMWNIATIVEKLINDAGYTLASGGFFASTFGQALYLLSAPDLLADELIQGKNLEVYVDQNSDNQADQSIAGLTFGYVALTPGTMVIDGEEEDEGSDFSTLTHQYTVPEDGHYRFQAKIEVTSTQNILPTTWSVQENYLTWSIRKNSTDDLAASGALISTSSPHLFDANNEFTLDTGYVALEAGDKIEVYITRCESGATNDTPVSQTASINITQDLTNSYLKAVWSERNLWPAKGNTISPSDLLPDLDGQDFLKGLRDMANLRFWVDGMNKTVYIETANDFYGSTVIDWRDKIDYNEEIEQEIIASNYKETQKLQYKPDANDKAYSNEVSANGVPFQKIVTLTNEYRKPGSEDRENGVFSPTPLGDMPQIGHWSYRKVPRIFGNAEFVGGGRQYPAERSKSWEPRILEWKGMVALTNGTWDWVGEFGSSSSGYTTFPSAETPDMNDMYTDYWLKDWARIDNNKIVTVTLKLTPSEIMKFHTVVGTPENEGFRAIYLLNIEGVDMYFLDCKLTTDGDRVKCEFIQDL